MIEQIYFAVRDVAVITGKSERTVREWKRLGVLRFVAGRTTRDEITRAMKRAPHPWSAKVRLRDSA